MNQELKPCPFCGASEEELMLFCDPDEGRDNSGPSRRIQCAVCHIEAPFYPTEDDAIAAWNKRAPALESRLSDPDALAREIAANAYASAGNPLVARLVRNGQADHMPGFIAALAALSAPAQRVEEGWRDIADAPKDGTMLRLLVVPDTEAWTTFVDSTDPYETIGFNNLSDTLEDRWEFAGWDWNQDHFVTGHGEVIGWLPFAASPAPAPHAGNEMGENLFNALHPFIGSANSTRVAVQELHRLGLTSAPHAGVDGEFLDYDAGLLNDFGGGDVSWWQDYLRAEIERANQHWRAALEDRT